MRVLSLGRKIHWVCILIDNVWVAECEHLKLVGDDILVAELVDLEELDVVLELGHLHLRVRDHLLYHNFLLILCKLQVLSHKELATHLTAVLLQYVLLHVFFVVKPHFLL